MLARVRLSVPDRPGSLGLVTSAIGAAAADIAKIDVLESESGRALDDVFVSVRDPDHLTTLRTRLDAVAGVTVTGVQYPAPPVTGHADLELIDQVLSRPERGLQTLVDGAPHAFGADWGALVEYGPDAAVLGVLAVSAAAPGPEQVVVTSPCRLATIRMTPPGAPAPFGGTALVPIGNGPLALVLVRPRVRSSTARSCGDWDRSGRSSAPCWHRSDRRDRGLRASTSCPRPPAPTSPSCG